MNRLAPSAAMVAISFTGTACGGRTPLSAPTPDASIPCPTGKCGGNVPEAGTDTGAGAEDGPDSSPADPCGAIGPDDCARCAGPCRKGHCVVTLASGETGGPSGIAVDPTSVYWVTDALGTVDSVPLGGGTPRTLVSGLGHPTGIAVDKTSIYWTDALNLDVMKAALDGSSPVTLLSN